MRVAAEDDRTRVRDAPAEERPMRNTVPRAATLALLGVLALARLAVSGAEESAVTGEELYVDRLGCWNCHGKNGGGGAGPRLTGTRLPLRRFVSQMRLPAASMPRFVPFLVSDPELATLYRWLDGFEPFDVPLPVTVALEVSPAHVAAAAVDVTAHAQDVPWRSDDLQYRVLLMRTANAPMIAQTLRYRPGGSARWLKTTTDDEGEALIGPDHDFTLTGTGESPTFRLQTKLPAPGRYSLVIEAMGKSKTAVLEVLGTGSAVLNVE